MQLHRLIYWTYATLLKVARKAGLTKRFRNLLGPLAGRLALVMSPGNDRPRLVQGHRMILAAQSRFPPAAMALGNYEPETTRLLESVLEPGMVFIDVGAHVGYYSLLAARQVGPEGKVYAFEPEPVNYSLLKQNVDLNGYSNVSIHPKAVSSSAGSSTLFISGLDSGRNSIYHHGLPEQGNVPVEATSLDTFLTTKGWPKVDLVKIDVEGAEIDVLQGMSHLLQQSEKLKLIMEFSPALLKSAKMDPNLFFELAAFTRFKMFAIDEATGLHPLAEDDVASLTAKLLQAQDSMNLFFTKE